MEETRFHDNMQTVFPNLVAVVQHRAAVPGTWRVALRRSIAIDAISSIIQTATQAFTTISGEDDVSSQRYHQLDVRMLHPDGLERVLVEGAKSRGTRQKFDEVFVRFGNRYGPRSQLPNAVASADYGFGGYCSLASDLSTMSNSGLVILNVQRGEVDAIFREVSYGWSSCPSSLLRV
jgi:hypothetical protein